MARISGNKVVATRQNAKESEVAFVVSPRHLNFIRVSKTNFDPLQRRSITLHNASIDYAFCLRRVTDTLVRQDHLHDRLNLAFIAYVSVEIRVRHGNDTDRDVGLSPPDTAYRTIWPLMLASPYQKKYSAILSGGSGPSSTPAKPPMS